MKAKPLNRESLKSVFGNGARPDASNFGSLIDSTVNIVDDGISKNMEDGLMLSPEGNESNRLVSFYDDILDNQPDWTVELQQEGTKGLGIVEPISSESSETRLFFRSGGNVGVNTQEPKTTLEVNGILATTSRVGTYIMDTAPADGQWHTIIPNLDGCVAFEVMAQVGKEKTGKYALLQAMALSTFGKSRSRIKTVQAYYGWWWNKISLRWHGSTFNYDLQIKTRSNYGQEQYIKFYITKLWDNEIMSLIKNPEDA
ncbi:MAG: adhesin [Bacteroidota bacterium]